MRPDLNALFGFRLLGHEASRIQPKVGGEPGLNLNQVMDKWGNEGAISRISSKVGGFEPTIQA